MKKQRLTVADQIEISLRSGNREKQAKLDSINAQCESVMANKWDVTDALELAADIAENVNAHGEAKAIREMATTQEA